MQADVVAGSQRQTPRDIAVEVAHGLLRCSKGLFHGRGVWQQGRAGFRKQYATTQPVKQRYAQLRLKQRNTLAHCRL